MNICSTFVAHFQPPETVQPSLGPFYDPAVSAQLFTPVHIPSRNSGKDVVLTQERSILTAVIAFIGMQFMWALAWATTLLANGGDSLYQLWQQSGFVDIGRCVTNHQRNPLSFDHKMALRARFSSIRRVRASLFAPPGAGTIPASTQARDQSNCSASPSRSNKTRCSLSNTPALCQSRNRLQQVIPLPQPNSLGSISQGIPVLSTNKIPLNTARFEMGGRPPFKRGFSGGKSGSITCHSSSLNSCFAIPQSYQSLGFC